MVYVEGVAQNQRILFPDVTDDQVEDDDPAQFIDAFMDSLGSVGLGFTYAEPDSTGHPPYLARRDGFINTYKVKELNFGYP